ncbi:hypothetical protein JCM10207_004757 [Rhodosporidiobolus poonsookiae]
MDTQHPDDVQQDALPAPPAPPSLSFPATNASPPSSAPPALVFPSDAQNDDDAPSSPIQRVPTLPLQLAALSLPFSGFGDSLADLLSPLQLSTSSARRRTLSRLSLGPGGAADGRTRRVSLFSNGGLGSVPSSSQAASPRLSAQPTTTDRRTRKDGREEEEVWSAPFPEEGEGLEEWIDGREVEEWSEEAWLKALASRLSDSLPLDLLFLPADADSSYELDILEHLSLPSTRAQARRFLDPGSRVLQPLVALVPLSVEWTAVLAERSVKVGEEGGKADATGEGVLQEARDLIGCIAFLHSQHIAHLPSSSTGTYPLFCRLFPLSPSPGSPASSFPLSLSVSATSFAQSLQLDPLTPIEAQLVAEPLLPGPLCPPETRGSEPWDAFKADAWIVGKVLQGKIKGAKLSPTLKAGLSVLAVDLAQGEPAKRISLKFALERVRELRV